MLSGEEILHEVENGNIVIEPFNLNQVNPNSYNLTISNELYVYTDDVLDCKKENHYKKITIPEDGITLVPGNFYIAKTREYTETKNHVPQISGRSSIGRVGLAVHISAGAGAIGFCGSWSLTISCTRPVKIVPGMELCQIYYFPLIGEKTKEYNGRYSNKGEMVPNKLYKDYED